MARLLTLLLKSYQRFEKRVKEKNIRPAIRKWQQLIYSPFRRWGNQVFSAFLLEI